jgi:WD40 repeat protein
MGWGSTQSTTRRKFLQTGIATAAAALLPRIGRAARDSGDSHAFQFTCSLPGSTVASVAGAVQPIDTAAPELSLLAVAANPAEVGQWSVPFTMPIEGVHALLLRTGKVLFLGGEENSSRKDPCALWTPPPIGQDSEGSFTLLNQPNNLFCSGHCFLPDGRVFFAGGHKSSYYGLNQAHIFDPASSTFRRVRSMRYSRWYPTCTALPDGRVLVVSGTSGVDLNGNPVHVEIPEVYNPRNDSWQQLSTAKLLRPMYPWMLVLPSGKVFNAGPWELTYNLNLDLASNQRWEAVGKTQNGTRSDYRGTALTYRPGKILIAGGSDSKNGFPSTNTAEIIDLNQADPQWQYTGFMKHSRRNCNSTLLPDGTVLVTGGSRRANYAWDMTPEDFVLIAEKWNPETGQWMELASAQRPRVYHSTGFLLPDGRVVVAGTNGERTLEIYSPHYLFNGERPGIASSPTTISYGSSFNVGFTSGAGTSIASVALVRPAAVTHSFNADQRYVPLAFSGSDRTLTIMAPASSNLAPPGYYMLSIVNDKGVPSIAPFVQLA